MKKKISKICTVLLIIALGSMETGWRLFNMMICCKRGARKKERKKWFELSHIKENHPQNGTKTSQYGEERNQVLSEAVSHRRFLCHDGRGYGGRSAGNL